MGVHGLWKLIDSAGKPIPIETLENKVLAVDVSIWLYQLVKGFQERAGRSVNNPFLLGLFRRICKLLFYRIKPVFIFDGGVPLLKKKTIAARQRNRSRANEISESLKRTLLENLAKQHALGKVLGEGNVQIPKMFLPKQDTMFHLPPLPSISKESDGDEDSDSSEEHSHKKYVTGDLHSIDITSEEFLGLPADMRHDILTELKETRKQNSWANIHLMPENSSDFSSFQMGRLLKRRAVQVGLEKAEGEMGSRGFTISDIQDILKQQGVDIGQRIAADNTTRYLYASSDGSKTLSQVPVKKRKSDTTNLEISGESDDDMSSSLEEYDVDDPGYVKVPNEGLTQEEILNLIKHDNTNKSLTNSKQINIDLPSTSTFQQPYEMNPNWNSIENDQVEKVKETVIQEHVNDQLLEHENVLNRDNEQMKVDHEILPRTNSYCKKSTPQKCSLSNSDEATYKISQSNISNEKSNTELSVDGKENPVSVVAHDDKDDKEANVNLVQKTELSSKIPPLSVSELSSDSDSDADNDFLEVTMNPSMDETIDTICSNDDTKLEIKIKTDEVCEEDMFADVFNSSNLNCKLSKNNEGLEDNLSLSKPVSHINNSKPSSPVVPLSEFPETICNEPEIKIPEETLLDQSNSSNTISTPSKDIETRTDSAKYFKIKQLNLEEVMNMKSNLEKESTSLIEECSREERVAATISEQTTVEAQELLRLFGLPFIVAPMEAEAQCAYLDLTGQTQGTITDDSDIWLFGANNVYKNFFDQKKFVKQFKASDIDRVYNLNREDLIMLAMLSGSDYTSGLPGIGPVNALEITAQFRPRDDSTTPDQRLSRFARAYLTEQIDSQLAKKIKNLEFVEGFPSVDVVKAYMSPTIDESREPFSWALPNIERLREYTQDKFGWNKLQTDQTLLPVFEKLKENKVQRTLHNYFEWAFDNLENKMSRRVEKAVNILGGGKFSPQKTQGAQSSQNMRNSTLKKPLKASLASDSLPLKSKTPAQLAREKAAKKLKEIKEKEKKGKKEKKK